MSEKPKVFISYSSDDEDFAELMKMKLEDSGIEVWKDTYQISPGLEWRKEIDSGLSFSDAVVTILNSNSSKSSYVTYEWAFSLGKDKEIIPVLLEKCKIHPRLEVLHYLDFTNGNREWTKLVNRIKQIKTNNSGSKIKVGQLTIQELEELLLGSKSLANAKAKYEGRISDAEEMTKAAKQMVSIKSNMHLTKDKNTILWVDDKPDNNIYEREALETLGFNFELALSTNSAIKMLSNKKYAAIISDMRRKEGITEGFVLLKKVRENDKEIPFFIYAGSGSIEQRIVALEKGAQGSTNRPYDLIELVTQYLSN